MSAPGQKRTWQQRGGMSAFLPTADMVRRNRDVCFVPFPDQVHCSKKMLFDHVIRLSQKRGRHSAGKTISRSSAKKRRDPLYRERERIAVRERRRRLRAARRRQASGHRTAATRKSGIKLLERESRCEWRQRRYSGQGMGVELSSVVLTPVRQADYWRVKIAWSKTIPRYFGKFHSQTEAEKWIKEHHWLTEQRQGPDVA
jgi:hypothetical protein